MDIYLFVDQGKVFSQELIGRLEQKTQDRPPLAALVQYPSWHSYPCLPLHSTLWVALLPHTATVKVRNPECSFALAQDTRTWTTQKHRRRWGCSWNFTYSIRSSLQSLTNNYSQRSVLHMSKYQLHRVLEVQPEFFFVEPHMVVKSLQGLRRREEGREKGRKCQGYPGLCFPGKR